MKLANTYWKFRWLSLCAEWTGYIPIQPIRIYAQYIQTHLARFQREVIFKEWYVLQCEGRWWTADWEHRWKATQWLAQWGTALLYKLTVTQIAKQVRQFFLSQVTSLCKWMNITGPNREPFDSTHTIRLSVEACNIIFSYVPHVIIYFQVVQLHVSDLTHFPVKLSFAS